MASHIREKYKIKWRKEKEREKVVYGVWCIKLIYGFIQECMGWYTGIV